MIWFHLKSLGTWRFVRAFGELQILTRASYTMLLLVPVLAGLWPTIREMLHYYEAFYSAYGDIELEKLGQPSGSNSIDLPDVWAIAFLGSLLAVVANLVYQVWAPETVKAYSKEQYLDAQVRRYNENPTESQLNEARNSVDGIVTSRTGGEVDPAYRDLTNSWHALQASRPSSQEIRESEIYDRERRTLSREYVRLAALEDYNFASRSAKIPAAAASILYCGALGAIAWIMISQTINVFHEAGWLWG